MTPFQNCETAMQFGVLNFMVFFCSVVVVSAVGLFRMEHRLASFVSTWFVFPRSFSGGVFLFFRKTFLNNLSLSLSVTLKFDANAHRYLFSAFFALLFFDSLLLFELLLWTYFCLLCNDKLCVYSLGNWNGVYGQSLKKYLLLGSMEVSFSTAQNLSSLKVYFYFVFVYTHTHPVWPRLSLSSLLIPMRLKRSTRFTGMSNGTHNMMCRKFGSHIGSSGLNAVNGECPIIILTDRHIPIYISWFTSIGADIEFLKCWTKIGPHESHNAIATMNTTASQPATKTKTK